MTGRAEAIIVPPGVDIEANIREARQKAKACEEKAHKQSHPDWRGDSAERILAFECKRLWILNNFRPGARYDYKQYGRQFEDFGNYHYGLYTRAMGINATLALAAAGWAQIKQGTSDWDNPEFIKSFFDDPRDHEMIKRGQRYPFNR